MKNFTRIPRGKSGTFNADSGFAAALTEYGNKGLEFIDFTSQIANVLYENISLSDKLDAIDFVAADYINDDSDYFAILLITNKSAYTHQVITDENGIHNEIMKHYAILPAPSQKNRFICDYKYENGRNTFFG